MLLHNHLQPKMYIENLTFFKFWDHESSFVSELLRFYDRQTSSWTRQNTIRQLLVFNDMLTFDLIWNVCTASNTKVNVIKMNKFHRKCHMPSHFHLNSSLYAVTNKPTRFILIYQNTIKILTKHNISYN